MKFVFSLLSGALLFSLQAAPTIGAAKVAPMTAVIGTPTQVRVQASIADPSVISGSMNVLQLNPNGTTTILGTLHDDGIGGDMFAGDLFFTLVVTLNASVATEVQLQVSAAFKGQLARVRSPIMSIFFQPANAPQQALATLAQSLASGNRPTALSYVNPSSNATTIINTYTQEALNLLASSVSAAVLVRSGLDSRIFQSPFTAPDGTTATLEFDMIPGAGGQWVINSW